MSNMEKNAYIIDGRRTPIGKFGGSFLTVSAVDLAAAATRGLLKKYPKVLQRIDQVIFGNVLSAGLGQNPARIAAMKVGVPETSTAYTINKVCGSGLQSVILGIQSILTGDADIVIAGGMENMSRCPYYIENIRFGKETNQQIKDGMIYDGIFCSLIGEHMGMTGEYIGERYSISRVEQDEYSLNSHLKAIAAMNKRRQKKTVIPVNVYKNETRISVTADEQPRYDTTLAKLASLKPVFKPNGTVTAGNASPLNDAAAVVLIASSQAVRSYGLTPLAVIRSYASVGLEPKYMGLGSHIAIEACLKKAKFNKSQVDLWEISEAFASQMLTVIKLSQLDPERINVNGGTLAYGHPIGATGTILLLNLLNELQEYTMRYGVVSLCIGGGQGIAALIEKV